MVNLGAVNLHDNSHKLITLICMTLAWTALYAAVHVLYKPRHKLSTKVVLDTKNRVISIVHGVATFIFACMTFIFGQFK